ncbi:MAG: SDR family NAD(P)-dependent oxidoreductase [Candidatus Binatia bacterium]
MAQAGAIVVGVGAEAGLGAALCRRLARGGLHIFVAGRTVARLDAVSKTIRIAGGSATAVATDTTSEEDVRRLFEEAEREIGAVPEIVVYNAGNNQFADFRQTEAALFEDMWRVGCFGGFLVGREAARRMVPVGRGTILFTGASGSLRGLPGFAHFAAAKAGLRMVAQAMGREFGPQGIHVAHVIIDGGINGERLRTYVPQFVQAKGDQGLLDLDAIAETYWQIHTQHPTAWTHEVDLRPFKEPF